MNSLVVSVNNCVCFEVLNLFILCYRSQATLCNTSLITLTLFSSEHTFEYQVRDEMAPGTLQLVPFHKQLSKYGRSLAGPAPPDPH